MSYRFDNYDQSIVIEGFENGIADSPHLGLSDMRNMNIVSIPGEAFVNFATSQISSPTITNASITSANTVALSLTYTGTTTLENQMAVSLSSITGLSGASTGTIYWAGQVSATTFALYTTYQGSTTFSSTLVVTTTGTANFSTYNVNQPKYFTNDGTYYWMVDLTGQVWSNVLTTGTNSYWTYTGNKVPTTATVGNGIVYYQASDGTGYVFVFHNSSIDYTKTATTNISWQYQWDPSAGTVAGYAATPTKKLKSALGSGNSHEAIVSPDNRADFIDGSWIGRFYETTPGTAFDPTNTGTYTYDQNQLLPNSDTANCITFLSPNILIGGTKNIIYSWDRFSINKTNTFILIPENSVAKLVTVNNKTFIFAGNRGRIYITNGSQADLYKKVPDHISGTIEPYFDWGGAIFNKNQLYFSMRARNNSQTLINNYGGVWAVNVDNGSIRLSNTLSYTSSSFTASAGFATALTTNIATDPAGTGLFIGWDNGSSVFGIDKSSSNPYTNSAASIDSDLIPIGTFQKQRQLAQIEYKLTKPMVSGESIAVSYRTDFSQSYTNVFTDSTAGNYSGVFPINFGQAQWIQFQVVLNSTASSPSYTRLKQIRLLGLTGPTLQGTQQLSI